MKSPSMKFSRGNNIILIINQMFYLVIALGGYWICVKTSWLSPINYFFLLGIVAIIFYSSFLSINKKKIENGDRTIFSLSKRISIFLLLTIFGLSLQILRDYQQPNSSSPYFTNIDHHAIRNTGVAFADKLILFSPEDDTLNGIWNSDEGYFIIDKVDEKGTNVSLRKFFTPVFKIADKKLHLLNPLYHKHMGKKFLVTDGTSSLLFSNISSKIEDDAPYFSFKISFSTTDTLLLGSSNEERLLFSDTAVIEDLKLTKGLELKTVIGSAKDFNQADFQTVVKKWLDQFDKNYLLTEIIEDNARLHFFPSGKLDRSCKIYNEDGLVISKSTHQFVLSVNDKFYVGLENSRKQMLLRPLDITEQQLAKNGLAILEFKDVST